MNGTVSSSLRLYLYYRVLLTVPLVQSWAPLQGTSTLQEIQRTGGKFSPDGSSVELGNQFLVTEDTIETVDILLVKQAFH